MTRLTRSNQDFLWNVEQEKSFNELKSRLMSTPILAHFDSSLPLELRTDACGYGIAGELIQWKDGKPQIIECVSRVLNKHERNYGVSHLECLAIVYSVNKLRHYLQGVHFTIKTDHHSLCFLMKIKDPSGMLARWALRMQKFPFTILYSSKKNHKDTDCL